MAQCVLQTHRNLGMVSRVTLLSGRWLLLPRMRSPPHLQEVYTP